MTPHPTDGDTLRAAAVTAAEATPGGADAWPGPAELATVGLRAAAWAIDLVVVAVLTAVLVVADVWFLRSVLHLSDVWNAAAPWTRKAAVVAIAAGLAAVGYLAFGQAGSGRSVGKRVIGLRPVQVARMSDGRVRLIQLRIRVALLRLAAHVLDLPLLWGFARPAWDRYRQTMADRIAHVFVVVDRDERCFEHERYLDKSADAEHTWWLCKQADDEIWRGRSGA
jgi:hypothetical protein